MAPFSIARLFVSLVSSVPRSSLTLAGQARWGSRCCFQVRPTHSRFRQTATHASLQDDELFNYTSGHWIFNDPLRHAERRRVFNVDGLCRLAAASVNRKFEDILEIKKLAEGGFNRVFLIKMRDDFKMVARIPYPVTVPRKLVVASEVATVALLRSFGLPIPQVYGYSSSTYNAAETEYIFMQYIEGTNLSNIWYDLDEKDIIPILRQIAELESKMMANSFPSGGSLYFSSELEELIGSRGIPLEDDRFCIGPNTQLHLWFGRRSQLEVERGPYETAEAAFAGGALKELAYLKQFGQPLLPMQRARRAAYHYTKQLPSAHKENLERYLLMAPHLIPQDPVLTSFRIRHPDLQPANIIVSQSPDSGWNIAGLIDWQHAAILPLFLHSGIPNELQNQDDIRSHQSVPTPPSLENLDEHQQSEEMERYRRHLVHFHYVKNTKEYNKTHFAALAGDPVGHFRRRLWGYSGELWEGETLNLKDALMDASENWEMVTGSAAPCPVVFDASDIQKTRELDKEQRGRDATMQACQSIIGHGSEGWVPTERYEEALARSKQMRRSVLAMTESDAERAEVEAHWFFDDMDEEEYM